MSDLTEIVTRQFTAWNQGDLDTWADAQVEVDEIRAGGNCVVVRIRYVTIGGDTGLPFETPMAAAFFLEDGRITLGQYFWEFGDALSTAGFAK